ncbi:MAG: transglycosylase SLT domain-containing protein [Anaeromyxobacteraceae bacterium]
MAALVTACVAARVNAAAAATEPLTGWLEGVATSAAALDRGDAGGGEVAARAALAAVPRGASGARAELALGLALRDAGRFAEATSALRRALGALPDPTLAAAARLALAESLFYSGHAGAAAPLFAELARSPGAASAQAAWREADALLEAGAPTAAARAYERLLSGDPTNAAAPGARLSLGAALRGAGDGARSATTWRALWRDRPADPAARAATRALRAARAGGADVPPPSPEDRLARATRFLELALPRRALAALDRLDASGPPADAARRGALLRALALLGLGRRDDAQAIGERLAADAAAEDGIRAGAELVLARAAARAHRADEAIARYRRIAASRIAIPGLPPAQARDLPEEAAYLVAWLQFDAGRYARAAEALHAYVREHPRARRADDARWFEAWAYVHLARHDEARRALDRLARGPLEVQARYWLARLAPAAQRRAAYQRVLAAAAPGSWYALLAASRLAALGEPAPAALPAAAPAPPAEGPAGDALARAARLAGAGLTASALAELRAIASSREVRTRAAAVAQLADALGDAELPFRMARDALAPTRRAQRWLYPAAFPEILPESAREAGVDPWLYRSVMRRESAFRRDARSGAGAVGLVQLIPPTAERLAIVYGVRPSQVRSLEDPGVSVPLGAAYLALLSERFAQPAVVLAAYNAGPPAAAAWASARAGVPLDAWVEDIAYRETRRYVKAVLADAVVFRSLHEGGALALDGAVRVPAPRDGVGF